MRGISNILFDMDGVLINSNAAIETFWKNWAEKENISIGAADIREKVHGRPTLETIELLFHQTPAPVKEAIYSSAKQFDNNMRPALLPGVKQLVSSLHAAGITTGVVTSAPADRVQYMLQPHGIYHLFNAIVTSADYNKGKPDPEPYRTMAIRLGTQPRCCLVFEDADSGIRAALDAGMYVVAVNNSAFAHEPRVLANIPDFTELSLHGASLLGNEGLLAQIVFSC